MEICKTDKTDKKPVEKKRSRKQTIAERKKGIGKTHIDPHIQEMYPIQEAPSTITDATIVQAGPQREGGWSYDRKLRSRT